MPIRQFFSRILRALLPRRPDVDAGPVAAPVEPPPVAPLARYLYEKSKFKAGRVREGAFLPPASLRLSVFVVDRLPHDRIVEIGQTVTSRRLLAYAVLRDKAAVEEQGLTIERDDTPPRHAEICGWPLEKEHQKEIAQALARAAELHQVTPASGA